MRVCISGSPGTGKTEIASRLSKITGFMLVEVKKMKIRHGYDAGRKAKIINPAVLEKAAAKIHGKEGNIILEGIPSHATKCDVCIVLRCSPDILAMRMKKRGWGRMKINENVQAEILDATTIEAIGVNKRVYEIDTSKTSIEKAANIAMRIINEPAKMKKYSAGRIDWTRKFAKMLIYRAKEK